MLWAFLYLLYIVLLLTVICVPLTILVTRKFFQKVKDRNKKNGQPFSVGFFHPYCNAGGGGERVLWCAIKAIQKRYPKVKVVVYTGDLNASPDEIIKRVKQRFDISFPRNIEFIYLHKRKWIHASKYPYFTLIGQSLGSVILGIEAMVSYLPDIYIDSMGFAFTLPLFSFIGGCTTACYVHFPTISTDMLKRISARQFSINNRLAVARSPALSALKVIYYRIFAWIYSFCGRFSDTVMVNSSWTEEHINSLWKCSLSTHRLYPPCDTKSLKELSMCKDIGEGGPIKIISIGQYRPEKDHPLQLKAMYELRQLVSEQIWDQMKLVFIGSCRDNDDFIRVKDMIDLSKHLSLENNVEFKVNIPFEEMKNELSSSMIGLHAMWNEHFGIGIVECMAAGHIMVAHRSGGPKEDIIEEAEGSRNGFLASDECEYADAIATIIKMSPMTRWKIREAARSSVDRFSTEEFEKGFLRTIEPLFFSSSV